MSAGGVAISRSGHRTGTRQNCPGMGVSGGEEDAPKLHSFFMQKLTEQPPISTPESDRWASPLRPTRCVHSSFAHQFTKPSQPVVLAGTCRRRQPRRV